MKDVVILTDDSNQNKSAIYIIISWYYTYVWFIMCTFVVVSFTMHCLHIYISIESADIHLYPPRGIEKEIFNV